MKQVIVPMLKKELNKNLIAIAADGSFGRHEDRDYSDLELMIFVKDRKHLPHGFSKIYNGMLVEGLFVTEKDYHATINEPNRGWYIAGSDKLLAITNPHFISKVQKYRTKHLARKCDEVAFHMLNEIQETFGKLFNAIDTGNRENLFPILSDVVMGVLRFIALVNHKPYTSLNSMISEAKRMKKKPHGFDRFIDLVTCGAYRNIEKLQKCARVLFSGIEELFKLKYGKNFYDDDLSTIKKVHKTKTRR